MTFLDIFLPVALVISWVLIALLCVKLNALESEFVMLRAREEVTDKEIDQLTRDIAWLKEIKKAGKLR
jgi:hypothetical protein